METIKKFREISEQYDLENNEELLNIIKLFFSFDNINKAKRMVKNLNRENDVRLERYALICLVLIVAKKNCYSLVDILNKQYPLATRVGYLKGMTYTLRLKGKI